jgi:uncharacterized membrane protein
MNLLNTFRAVAIVAIGLLAGIFVAVVAMLPARMTLEGAAHIRFLQVTHIYYQRMMPPMVLSAIIFGLGWCFLLLRRRMKRELIFAAAAVLLTIACAAITFTINVPLNDTLMTWDPANPPSNYLVMWQQWENSTIGRTALSVLALISGVLGVTFGRREM